MLSFEPSRDVGVRDPSQPPVQLWAHLSALYEEEPKRIEELFLAAAKLGLELGGGLASSLNRYVPSEATRVSSQATTRLPALPKLTDEQLFVACRDALATDWMTRIWQEKTFTYAEIREAIIQETARLSVGDDPREPW